MTELRSKRDRSDTASLMTVDEITAEVESRRASMSVDQGSDMDDWTQVNTGDDLDDDTMEDTLNEAAESEEEDAEETTYVDDEDENQPKRITSRGGKCQPNRRAGFHKFTSF
jgi:mitogen-activated protein kinase kinase kinase